MHASHNRGGEQVGGGSWADIVGGVEVAINFDGYGCGAMMAGLAGREREALAPKLL